MKHENLIGQLELELDPEFRFTEDQATVMHAFQEGTGRVCVGSGAGTGKTTTMTRVVAESVVRMAQPSPDSLDANPFDNILVTTFTRDAAGQLQTKIKQLLREHEENAQVEFDPALWRWIETDSHISTIDSFTSELLNEIAPEARVAPDFDVRDEIETEELLREVIRAIEDQEEYEDALEVLETGLEDISVKDYLHSIQQKLRELCYSFAEPDAEPGTTIFADQMKGEIHNGREPLFDDADIRNIVSHVTGIPESGISIPDVEDIHSHINEDYAYNVGFAEALDALIDVFEAEYDQRTRTTGKLSYQDITYIVWQYLEEESSKPLQESLATRFSKIFIDEFQDTSLAQSQILSHLIQDSDAGADILIIGDVKQSIYGWRSADPEIFARILEHADSESSADPYLGVPNWTRAELVTNFRSHPHLIWAGNHLFDYVFSHEGLGAVGTFPINFEPLRPHRASTNPEQARLHVLPLGDVTAEEWRTRDPQQTAAAIHGMVEGDELTIDDGEDERPVRAGDVTLLFRRGIYMQSFREALDDHGLDNAIVADRGLFKNDEIGFIIDVLDWFANPHSKDSLLRILRSPVTALSDKSLRFLASQDWNLPVALEEWSDSDLPSSDKERLTGLVDLRSDLRWDREDSKAELVQKIIQHTGIEIILLAGPDAVQRYGNLWVLVELVRDWEDEELLPYRDFVNRLKWYQEMARANDETFENAQIADSSADHTVKLRTVHSSKGLEFSVVFLPDLLASPGGRVQSRDRVTFRDSKSGEPQFGLRPRPSGEPVQFDDGPGTKWTTDSYRATLWLAPERDENGQFRYDHPYNPAIEDEFAEFWRLLYVAFTRAGDHLFLPLGDDISPGHHNWSTWAHPLLNIFQHGTEWPDSGDGEIVEFNLDDTAMVDEDDSPMSIPFDIGASDLAEPVDTGSLGMPDIETVDSNPSQPTSNWDEVPFAPRELSPSTLHDLIACPKRYQYRALEEVSEARGESPPGTNAPDGYSPAYWGTLVHQMLERCHEDILDGRDPLASNDTESKTAEFLDQHEEIRDRFREVLNDYRNLGLWTKLHESEVILPEYELSAIHPEEPKVHVSGIVDLLMKTSEGWEIIDFKTGSPPADASYLADQYRSQLETYAWMLQSEYDIAPVRAKLFYVQDGSTHEYEPDQDQFQAYLRELPNDLEIHSETGLPTKPDPDPATNNADELDLESRCGSCPFISICAEWNKTDIS